MMLVEALPSAPFPDLGIPVDGLALVAAVASLVVLVVLAAGVVFEARRTRTVAAARAAVMRARRSPLRPAA